MTPHSVHGADGVRLWVADRGPRTAATLVFIHGFCQSHLSWSLQTDALSSRFRTLAYDLRGHGNSDKPLDEAAYRNAASWAADLHAILRATRARNPILVGWSYGGLVMCEYLQRYGSEAIAGLVFVDALIKLGGSQATALLGPGFLQHVEGLIAADLQTRIAANRAFLRDCFTVPPDSATFETLLSFNMVVPPEARRSMVTREVGYEDIVREIDRPTLVVHGTEDKAVRVQQSELIATAARGSRLSLFTGAGHAPFFEKPLQFNRELEVFAEQVAGLELD